MSLASKVDGILVATLRIRWKAIQHLVIVRYQRGLASDHHPKALRRADLVLLKPDKRDLDSVKSWHLIALYPNSGYNLKD